MYIIFRRILARQQVGRAGFLEHLPYLLTHGCGAITWDIRSPIKNFVEFYRQQNKKVVNR